MFPAPAATVAASNALLFQLEIESREAARPKPVPRRDVHSLIARLDNLTRPETSFEARLARDAAYYHAATLEEEGRADVVILASRLAGVGYNVTIRTALGGGSGVTAFRHLSHEFLVVAAPGDGYLASFGAPEYIVDPRFREQFDIPQPVAWYDKLLASVSDAYVGPPARLRSVVKLLSGEMAAAFTAAGSVTPPWRSASSLLSKWLPQKSRDMHVGDPAGAPLGACSLPAARLGRMPTFAEAGAQLRTTSAEAAFGGGHGGGSRSADGSSNGGMASMSGFPGGVVYGCQAGTGGGAAIGGTSPPPLMAIDSSEDERMVSPDTTLVWAFPAAPGAAIPRKYPDASAARNGSESAAADGAVVNGIRRSISREQLAAGSGGRSPPSGLSQQLAGGSPKAVAAPTAVAEEAGQQSPANSPYLQQLPPARRRGTNDAALCQVGFVMEAQRQGLPLRRSSTSALSSKLAARKPPSAMAAASSPISQQQQVVKLPQLRAPAAAAASVAKAAAPIDKPLQDPSVHDAPFWNQPIVAEYISQQQNSSHGGRGNGSGNGSDEEPRIRTVKMRGAATAGAARIRAR